MSRQQANVIGPELQTTITMLGDSWILAILCNLSRNSLRFSQLQRAVEGINPTTLTNRLKKLETQGIIVRETETVDKLSVVYHLSKKGKAFLPVISQLRIFAETFYKNT